MGHLWLVASLIDASFLETRKFDEVHNLLRLTNTAVLKLAEAYELGSLLVCDLGVFEGP